MSWTVLPEWYGERAFILGCGPSLQHAPIQRIMQSGRVIATNDAYLRAPHADILYFCDKTWWEANRVQVSAVFRGRHIVTMDNILEGVRTLRCSGPEGLESDPGALRHGSNSGYQAINLAYHLGATEIVLVGFDMRVVNGNVHWRTRSFEQPDAQERTMRYSMLPKFTSLLLPLEAAGVKVVNATEGSALTVWPVVPLERVLNASSRRFNGQ